MTKLLLNTKKIIQARRRKRKNEKLQKHKRIKLGEFLIIINGKQTNFKNIGSQSEYM